MATKATKPATKRRRTKVAEPDRRAPLAAIERELEVHREELATQNEELRRANASLLLARDRYAQLYDRSPLPYVTLDDVGRIVEANIAASELLEKPRSALFGRCLDDSIAPSSRQSFRIFRRRVVEGLERRHENVLVVGSRRIGVRLDATPLESPSALDCLVCITELVGELGMPGAANDVPRGAATPPRNWHR